MVTLLFLRRMETSPHSPCSRCLLSSSNVEKYVTPASTKYIEMQLYWAVRVSFEQYISYVGIGAQKGI